MKSDFYKAKLAFEDENKGFEAYSGEYILLDSLKSAYSKLLQSVSKPLKMIMLFGPPGSGKTALLNRLSSDLKLQNSSKTLVYLTPTFASVNELKRIYDLFTNEPLPKDATFFDILTKFNSNFPKDSFLIILDEAQLYLDDEMELIRLLSDTRVFKFIIALHKLENEDQIAKAHFQTRIWETIHLKPITKDELKFFVEKKLLNKDLSHIITAIDDKYYTKIHKWTNGNIRESLKFFYRFFDYYDYIESNQPKLINRKKFSNKTLEMFAIHCGYIKV